MATPRKADAPPADLERDSKALWKVTIAALEKQGTWTLSDLPLLERYIRAVQLERTARGDMDNARDDHLARRRLAHGSTGQLVAHPLEAIRQKADADAHKYADALLLTPLARQRNDLEAGEAQAGKFGAALG